MLTTTAAEKFVIELARVSKKGTRVLRGLSSHDKDDVIATAILDCWEHKDQFDPAAQSLERWFEDALYRARRQFKRGQFVTVSEFNARMQAPDDTSARAEAMSAIEELKRQLTPQQQDALYDMAMGRPVHSEMRDRVRVKLAHLRDLIPHPVEFQKVIRAGFGCARD